MADYYVNIFLDDDKLKKIESAGLSDQVKEIDGKKAVQVDVTKKEMKKLKKGFPGLDFDASNAAVLPEDAENTVMGIIVESNSLQIMKMAIMKIYNPLAGKTLRAAK
ncbi:conserved hypothetical protein [Candidatus Magnetomoraceae bacterium gMMP-15]